MAEDNSQKKVQYQIGFGKDVSQAGTYSNVVSVHVNKNEVVLDFGYNLPNSNPPQIMINSRVNMNHETAKSDPPFSVAEKNCDFQAHFYF